jgi:hypothetical protein
MRRARCSLFFIVFLSKPAKTLIYSGDCYHTHTTVALTPNWEQSRGC